jgi:hypothetical protein
MRAKSFQEASRTAFRAAACLDAVRAPEKDTVLCLRGAALLSAAAAWARSGNRREAHVALNTAAVCAAELSEERCELGAVFGPTNLAIHQVAVAIELGSASEAIQHIPHVNLDRLPSYLAERRARFLIDVAEATRTFETIQRPWMHCCTQRLSHPMNSGITGSRIKYCVSFCHVNDTRPGFARSRLAACWCIRKC